MVGALKQHLSQNDGIDVSKTSDAQKVEEFRSQLRLRNLSPASL